MLPLVTVFALLTPAHAGATCDSIAKRAESVSTGEIPATYVQLVGCDRKMAEERFDSFMRASKDVDTLVALSLAAIDNGVHSPVWPMLEQVPDVAARDEVARQVGASCGAHPQVVPFLKGAYSQLRDRQFGTWRESFRACATPELDTWLGEMVGHPPSVAYDEKYNVITDAFVKRARVTGLPQLRDAAIASGKGSGPFTTVLDRMNEAVRPETFGGEVKPEDRAALEGALVEVARAVSPELAAQVADRLYQAGAEAAAASLLPTIYADRVQGKGVLTYGVAAVEACGKDAVIHYAEVTEPAKRWSIADDVQGPARAFKPKLKCTAEGEWPVLTTPEPVAKGGLDTWLAGIVKEWSGNGVAVAVREEKAIILD